MIMKKTTAAAVLAIVFAFASCGEGGGKETTNADTAVKTEVTPAPPPAETASEKLVDIKQISGKSMADVEAVLGTAESKEPVKGSLCPDGKCEKALFKGGQYEIMFKAGMANRITINKIPDWTSNDAAIEQIGLPATKPAFKNPGNVIRYNNVEGINEISFFTDYALVLVTK